MPEKPVSNNEKDLYFSRDQVLVFKAHVSFLPSNYLKPVSELLTLNTSALLLDFQLVYSLSYSIFDKLINESPEQFQSCQNNGEVMLFVLSN